MTRPKRNATGRSVNLQNENSVALPFKVSSTKPCLFSTIARFTVVFSSGRSCPSVSLQRQIDFPLLPNGTKLARLIAGVLHYLSVVYG